METKELKNYTVRIKAEDKSGTGFFVASGLILTCSHVVTKGDNRELIKEIKVYWNNQEYTANVHTLPKSDRVDLALLKLDPTISEHSYVSLDESINNGDSLFSFGYTDDYPNGDPRDFTYIEITGCDPPLMTFKDEQVQPGFSGSPLLNKRTGKICGLIKRSRDIYNNLGGRGISVTVIFEHFPELKPTVIPHNPFIPLSGKINKANLVFGREKEVNEIFDILNSGASVALIGDSGVGKSSLLQVIEELAEKKLKQSRKPIYLNLGRCSNDNDFYATLCQSLTIPFNDEDPWKILNFNREIDNHKCLLILDEIHTMTWQGFTNPVRTNIRSLANDGENSPIKLVVAARKALNRLFPDSSNLVSPFENVCLEVYLKNWETLIIQDFINKRLIKEPLKP